MSTQLIRFPSLKEMEVYIRQQQLKEILMADLERTKTTKRKDDSLAELQRVVSQLKDLASLHGKILGEVVETLATKEETKKETQRKPRISDVSFGYTFKRQNNMLCIRCRPTSYLLNSTLVSESLAVGKQLIMNVKEGTVFFVENEEISV